MRVLGPYNKTNWVTGEAIRVNPTAMDYLYAAVRTVMDDGHRPTLVKMNRPTLIRVARKMRERSLSASLDTTMPPTSFLGVPVAEDVADSEPFRVQYGDGREVLAKDVNPNCLPPFTYADVTD